MILNIYAFKNKAVGAFAGPVYSDKVLDDYLTLVQRAIKYAVHSGKDDMHYEDLDLYFFGSFDDESGEFTLYEPHLVLNCSDYKAKLLEANVSHEN